VELCWLYCPDEVIRRANAFLDSVKTGAKSPELEPTRRFAEFVLAVRNDLLKRHVTRRTSLTADDYRFFSAN